MILNKDESPLKSGEFTSVCFGCRNDRQARPALHGYVGSGSRPGVPQPVGQCNGELPQVLRSFTYPPGLHGGQNFVSDRLNLEPNSILRINAKHFSHSLNVTEFYRNATGV